MTVVNNIKKKYMIELGKSVSLIAPVYQSYKCCAVNSIFTYRKFVGV
jgi:hypothetical protein